MRNISRSCTHVYILFPGQGSQPGPDEEENFASIATTFGTRGRGVIVVTIRGSRCLTPAAPYTDTTSNVVLRHLIRDKVVLTNGELNSVRKHNYNIMLNDGIY